MSAMIGLGLLQEWLLDGVDLVTFQASPGEGLLVALDSSNVLRLALMPRDLRQWHLVEIKRWPLLPPLGQVLPCSVAVRCGVLGFVEAASLEARNRTLHVWKLAEFGQPLPTPRHLAFPFCTSGQAAVSVPRPLFGRWMLVKNCCHMEQGRRQLGVMLFDHEAHEGLIYHEAMEADDSTLFRRCHPLADLILGFWTPAASGQRLLLINLGVTQREEKRQSELQRNSLKTHQTCP